MKRTKQQIPMTTNTGTKSAILMACALIAFIAIGCSSKVAEKPVYWPVDYSPKISDFPEETVAPRPHIKSVRLILDSYVPLLENKIRASLETERKVGDINIIPERRIIEIFAKGDKSYLNLYDIRSRVDSVRGVNVTRMDVLVVGKIESFTVSHGDSGADPFEHTRYKAIAGDQSNQVFILADNSRMDEITSYKLVVLVGHVTAFDDNAPILEVTDFAPVKGSL